MKMMSDWSVTEEKYQRVDGPRKMEHRKVWLRFQVGDGAALMYHDMKPTSVWSQELGAWLPADDLSFSEEVDREQQYKDAVAAARLASSAPQLLHMLKALYNACTNQGPSINQKAVLEAIMHAEGKL